MSGHDKDDLSRFFRKATQKPEIKFNEGDWTKLEAMLDKASAEGVVSSRNRRNKFITAAAIMLIILSGVTYFTITKRSPSASGKESSSNPVSSSDQKSNSISLKSTDEKISPDAMVPAPRRSHDAELTTSVTDAERNKNILKPGQQHFISNTTTNVLDQPLSKPQPSDNTQSMSRNSFADIQSTNIKDTIGAAVQDQRGSLRKPTSSFENTNSITSDHTTNSFDQKRSSINETDESESISVDLGQRTSNEIGTPDKSVPDSLNILARLTQEKDSVKTSSADHAGNQNDVKPSRWRVLFSVAPDFSSNSFQHITNPGEAIGITGYYRIAPKLNVFVGVIGSNKKYLSYGKEYKPKEDHYWSKHTNGMVPTEINGSCFMLEVPIGIQYTALNMKKNRVLVSAMLSNYTMFNESYAYVFPAENPGAAQGWKSKKTTSYPLSVLGASVSLEHDLSSRVAIGFSPYLKIPLRDMGTWTTMRLYTVGAAITLRFTFQKPKIPITLSHRERSG